VVDASYEQFQLDYGDGTMIVEMDDWDADDDAVGLLPNDRVEVSGRIDDDFFETRTLEASSVYVEGLGTRFYANSADEEGIATTTAIALTPRVTLTGEVVAVRGRTFDLDAGALSLTVDAGSLPYDPFDDEGFLKIEPGDRVQAAGELEETFFDQLQLDATWLTKIDSGS